MLARFVLDKDCSISTLQVASIFGKDWIIQRSNTSLIERLQTNKWNDSCPHLLVDHGDWRSSDTINYRLITYHNRLLIIIHTIVPTYAVFIGIEKRGPR